MTPIAARRPRGGPVLTALAVITTFFAIAIDAAAQRPQVTTQVPFRSVNDSFFERIGFNANFSRPGFFFNLGGFPNAIPQFGGFQPGAGLTGGFGVRGGGGNANFGFEFSQGSRRSLVSQTPIVTTPNGVGGIVQDLTITPFVINAPPMRNIPLPWKQQFRGYVPRRGSARAAAAAPPPKDLGEAIAQRQLAADADQPIRSVADIRRNRQADDAAANQAALKYLQRAQQAEKNDKTGLAKIYYRLAADNATGELKQRLLERLNRLNRQSD